MRRVAALFAALLVVALCGCATTTIVPTRDPDVMDAEADGPAAASVSLLPIDAWPAEVSLRQRVEIRWGVSEGQGEGEVAGFEAVLEKRDGTLMLVGLGPMSRPGFVIRATDEALEFTNRTGRDLPFDPAHVLADVQRVFYPWDEATTPTDLVVEERREAGRIVERRFRRADDPDGPAIRVTFGPRWHATPRVPESARVDNGWFGYTISVETFAATRLEPESAPKP